MADPFVAYMDGNNSGRWREWPETQIADAKVDFYAGWDAAVEVFTTKFYGGPTKDMVLGWLVEARGSSGPEES